MCLLSGGEQFVTASSEMMVHQFKGVVANATGVPAHRQQLLFKGVELLNNDTLTNAGVLDGGSVLLVERDGASSAPTQKVRALYLLLRL